MKKNEYWKENEKKNSVYSWSGLLLHSRIKWLENRSIRNTDQVNKTQINYIKKTMLACSKVILYDLIYIKFRIEKNHYNRNLVISSEAENFSGIWNFLYSVSCVK